MPEAIVKKRVAVVGSRDFADKHRLYEILTKNYERIKMIVSGGARGADTLAVEWATDYGVPYLVFPAAWRNPFTGVQDKGAGFRRNRRIVEVSDVVIAFWDGKSPGTAHTIETAKQLKKDVRIIKFEPAQPKPSVPVDFKTGQPVDVAHRKLDVVPPVETPLQAWFRSWDGLCCSTPICEHQEWPKEIESTLRQMLALGVPDDATLEKMCGVPIDKIRPILETVDKIVEGEHGYAEAMMGEHPMGHCCTPEAMQVRDDFYRAQEEQYAATAEATPKQEDPAETGPSSEDVL